MADEIAQKITAFVDLPVVAADDVFAIVDDPDGAGKKTKKAKASAININLIRTAAEISASIVPTNFSQSVYAYDVRRLGILPNDTGLRTANTTALKALLDPTVTGPLGQFIFPNTTGADTYYFDDIIQIRPGCHLDLNQCTLNFAKSYVSADDRQGFFTFIRDVSIVNGSIVVNYDGSAGTNAGMIMLIGSRKDYAFGTFTNGIDDEDLTVPMGNIRLNNLRITTNNPGPLMCVLMFGGLENSDIKNVVVNGQDVVEHGFLYEFGFYHHEATVANVTTSHAINLNFTNITGKDMKDDGSAGSVVAIIGANSAKLTNISGDVVFHVVEVRPGEALFFNVGPPYVFGGKTRPIVLENITGQNLTNTGMSLVGAASASSGFLSGEYLSEAQQTDLYSFSVDGFSFDETIASVSGPLSLKNGVGRGGGTSGALILGDECVQFDIDNVRGLDSAGIGLRANIADGIFSTPRLKIGTIRNSQFAGNAGAGMNFNNTESIAVLNNRLGYNALYDGSIGPLTADATTTTTLIVDAALSFRTNELIGQEVVNSTRSLSATISANTATTITHGTIAGQTSGDTYTIQRNETTQDQGVVVSTNAFGVKCDGNYVSTSGGAVAYAMSGTGPRGSEVRNMRGLATLSGKWIIDGILAETSANIADKTATINTTDKHLYKKVWDSSNDRLMIALGTTDVSAWERADGGATVTPV